MAQEEQGRPQQPLRGVNWDSEADNYNSFVMCELEDTDRYLDLIGIEPGDTVLDVCCGPGRITMLAAERAAHVTGIDLSANMLEHARENIEARGLANVSFQQIDWAHVLPGQNVARHDVVIASRNQAMGEVEKLSALARKTVMIQIFADAPSIPALQATLFSGCKAADGREMFNPGAMHRPGPGGAAGPGPFGGDPLKGREPGAYFNLFAKAYAAGYDPNVRIMPERFRKVFATKGEALEWVCSLHPEFAAGNEERVAANIEPLLAETDEGVEFCIATTAAIIWWRVDKPRQVHGV